MMVGSKMVAFDFLIFQPCREREKKELERERQRVSVCERERARARARETETTRERERERESERERKVTSRQMSFAQICFLLYVQTNTQSSTGKKILPSVGWFSFALHVTCYACYLFFSRILFLLLLSRRLKHGCQHKTYRSN
jgi:cation transport ATPase